MLIIKNASELLTLKGGLRTGAGMRDLQIIELYINGFSISFKDTVYPTFIKSEELYKKATLKMVPW